MQAEEYYRDVDPEWCQGDIIRQIPHIHLKPPLKVVRKETTKSGEKLAAFEYQFGTIQEKNNVAELPPGGFKFDIGEQAIAFCQLAFGVILSHGCEIDKDSKHRTVALIRPLSNVSQGREIIKANDNFSYWYLPAYGEIMGESYVDFRRITTLHPDFLKNSERIVSLTDNAVKHLQMQYFRYLTRRDIKAEVLDQLS